MNIFKSVNPVLLIYYLNMTEISSKKTPPKNPERICSDIVQQVLSGIDLLIR